MVKPQYWWAHQRARKRLLAANPWCAYCGGPATVADHQPPISLHHQIGTGCCVLVPSCARCSVRQGGYLTRRRW
jgi:hypothetical protein